MPHFGTLQDYRFEDRTDDIRGAALYGSNQEKLGKIDDVIFDHATGELKYVVVESGGWFGSKRFLVPADRVRSRDSQGDRYVANLSKSQIHRLPEYDESTLNDERRWGEYEREYRRRSADQHEGVLDQAGGTNILVPDSVPTSGSVATTESGQPVSGYKSPIRHHEPGMMDTSPTGSGQNPESDRLRFVPDAVAGDRGDVKDKETRSLSAPSPGEAEVSGRAREIVHRQDDRPYGTTTDEDSTDAEETIEGDAIFNQEDLAGRRHEFGNVHDADEPSYKRVGGSEPSGSRGRLPNYPDASQGTRWARFEENLRRQRPKIVRSCGLCDEAEDKPGEDAA